ncbi:MAG TPA: transglutaminase family protein [Polyangiaceae bacterium]|nr:transglutaminase family protein [Polyangiaceae bacterium]
MVYRVSHLTSYRYAQAVSICHNEARLTPRTTSHQRLLRSQLLVEPVVATHDRGVDYFGNGVHWFSLQEAHTHLDVTAVSEVDVTPFQAPALALSGAWEQVRDRVCEDRSAEGLTAYEFVFESPHVRFDTDLVAYAQPSFPRGRPLLEAVLDLTKRIHKEFQYQPGSTTVATPLREVLRARRGVCQDFAHLQIGMLRSLGLSARYVSGYVYNQPREGEKKLTGADASHAWVGVYCPDFGYVDFDPTNGVIPSDEHVTLAWGRDFSDASPLKGVILGGGEHTVSVAVDVSRV